MQFHSGGGVAQLGERRVRNAKVEGSTPFTSTINPSIEMCCVIDAYFLLRIRFTQSGTVAPSTLS